MKHLVYVQALGKTFLDGETVGAGYAGHGEGVNNPAMQYVKNVGPIPVGWYTIGPVFSDPQHGPICMHLWPDKENEMHGRDGFLFHLDRSDRATHPREASAGCIVHEWDVLQRIAQSGITRLRVVSYWSDLEAAA